MALQTLQIITLFTALTLLLAQLLVNKKQTSHILFAIFCGSIAMMLTKEISGKVIGSYQFIIGMGACVTCNGYWLLSRALFRGKNAITTPHILAAATIAILVLTNQAYQFAVSENIITKVQNDIFHYMIVEAIVLLSSCIMVLTIWEACRNYSYAEKHDKAQRVFFLITMAGALIGSIIFKGIFAANPDALSMAIASIVLIVLINTQVLLLWRTKFQPVVAAKALEVKQEQTRQNQADQTKSAPLDTYQPIEQISNSEAANSNQIAQSNEPKAIDESELATQIKALLIDDSLFLQANLKVADIARLLDVPEYRVSNALRHNLNARNFNHYVNELRIKHAQNLLADEDKQKWSVLVVALESGFASVGPFTRAFKATTGFTPNQYRKSLEDAC